MASKKGRKNGNWRPPVGRQMRCILNVLVKQRRDRAFVVGEYKRLCPDYQAFHKNPISDGAIWGRADIGVRAGYEREHPDKNPAIARYLPAAIAIVKAGVPVTEQELRNIVARVDGPEPGVVDEPEPANEPIVAEEPTGHAEPDWRVRWLIENGYPTEAAELKAGLDPILPGMPDDYDDEEELADEGEDTEVIEAAPPPAPSPSAPEGPPPPLEQPFRALLGETQTRAGPERWRPTVAAPLYWTPSELMNYGVLVTGDPGSGKTQILRAVIAEVAGAGFPVTVLDFKYDYTDPALGLPVYDVDRDGLPFNPLAPVADARGEAQPIRHAQELVSVLRGAFGLADLQAARLMAALSTAYLNRGIDPRRRYEIADLPAPPTWAEVIEVLQNETGVALLLHRLAPISNLDLFPERDGVAFADLIRRPVALDLHLLPDPRLMAAMAELLVARLHGHLLRGEQPRAFRRLVVVDEAHRLAHNERLAGLGREGRAFGVGLAVGTQFPGDLPLELSGTLATKLFLYSSEDKHRRAAAKALVGTLQGYGAEIVLRELGQLRQHQAMAQMGGRYAAVDLVPHYQRIVEATGDDRFAAE